MRSVPKKPIPHGTENGYAKYRCRCNDCRAAKRAVMREYAARRRAQGRPLTYRRRYEPRACEWCSTEFDARMDTASRFCSNDCANLRQVEDGEARRVAHLSTIAPVHVGPRPESWGYAPPIEATVVTLPKWWGVITNGPCSWCGTVFTSTGHDAKYCSKKCASAKSKASRGERFQPSPILRRAIYERDGWVCQLCGDPTDPNADPWSDWYPSLDHIIPQSHTLIPDHSAENLRCCHRWCNAVRGNLTHYTDADFAPV